MSEQLPSPRAASHQPPTGFTFGGIGGAASAVNGNQKGGGFLPSASGSGTSTGGPPLTGASLYTFNRNRPQTAVLGATNTSAPSLNGFSGYSSQHNRGGGGGGAAVSLPAVGPTGSSVLAASSASAAAAAAAIVPPSSSSSAGAAAMIGASSSISNGITNRNRFVISPRHVASASPIRSAPSVVAAAQMAAKKSSLATVGGGASAAPPPPLISAVSARAVSPKVATAATAATVVVPSNSAHPHSESADATPIRHVPKPPSASSTPIPARPSAPSSAAASGSEHPPLPSLPHPHPPSDTYDFGRSAAYSAAQNHQNTNTSAAAAAVVDSRGSRRPSASVVAPVAEDAPSAAAVLPPPPPPLPTATPERERFVRRQHSAAAERSVSPPPMSTDATVTAAAGVVSRSSANPSPSVTPNNANNSASGGSSRAPYQPLAYSHHHHHYAASEAPSLVTLRDPSSGELPTTRSLYNAARETVRNLLAAQPTTTAQQQQQPASAASASAPLASTISTSTTATAALPVKEAAETAKHGAPAPTPAAAAAAAATGSPASTTTTATTATTATAASVLSRTGSSTLLKPVPHHRTGTAASSQQPALGSAVGTDKSTMIPKSLHPPNLHLLGGGGEGLLGASSASHSGAAVSAAPLKPSVSAQLSLPTEMLMPEPIDYHITANTPPKSTDAAAAAKKDVSPPKPATGSSAFTTVPEKGAPLTAANLRTMNSNTLASVGAHTNAGGGSSAARHTTSSTPAGGTAGGGGAVGSSGLRERRTSIASSAAAAAPAKGTNSSAAAAMLGDGGLLTAEAPIDDISMLIRNGALPDHIAAAAAAQFAAKIGASGVDAAGAAGSASSSNNKTSNTTTAKDKDTAVSSLAATTAAPVVAISGGGNNKHDTNSKDKSMAAFGHHHHHHKREKGAAPAPFNEGEPLTEAIEDCGKAHHPSYGLRVATFQYKFNSSAAAIANLVPLAQSSALSALGSTNGLLLGSAGSPLGATMSTTNTAATSSGLATGGSNTNSPRGGGGNNSALFAHTGRPHYLHGANKDGVNKDATVNGGDMSMAPPRAGTNNNSHYGGSRPITATFQGNHNNNHSSAALLTATTISRMGSVSMMPTAAGQSGTNITGGKSRSSTNLQPQQQQQHGPFTSTTSVTPSDHTGDHQQQQQGTAHHDDQQQSQSSAAASLLAHPVVGADVLPLNTSYTHCIGLAGVGSTCSGGHSSSSSSHGHGGNINAASATRECFVSVIEKKRGRRNINKRRSGSGQKTTTASSPPPLDAPLSAFACLRHDKHHHQMTTTHATATDDVDQHRHQQQDAFDITTFPTVLLFAPIPTHPSLLPSNGKVTPVSTVANHNTTTSGGGNHHADSSVLGVSSAQQQQQQQQQQQLPPLSSSRGSSPSKGLTQQQQQQQQLRLSPRNRNNSDLQQHHEKGLRSPSNSSHQHQQQLPSVVVAPRSTSPSMSAGAADSSPNIVGNVTGGGGGGSIPSNASTAIVPPIVPSLGGLVVCHPAVARAMLTLNSNANQQQHHKSPRDVDGSGGAAASSSPLADGGGGAAAGGTPFTLPTLPPIASAHTGTVIVPFEAVQSFRLKRTLVRRLVDKPSLMGSNAKKNRTKDVSAGDQNVVGGRSGEEEEEDDGLLRRVACASAGAMVSNTNTDAFSIYKPHFLRDPKIGCDPTTKSTTWNNAIYANNTVNGVDVRRVTNTNTSTNLGVSTSMGTAPSGSVGGVSGGGFNTTATANNAGGKQRTASSPPSLQQSQQQANGSGVKPSTPSVIDSFSVNRVNNGVGNVGLQNITSTVSDGMSAPQSLEVSQNKPPLSGGKNNVGGGGGGTPPLHQHRVFKSVSNNISNNNNNGSTPQQSAQIPNTTSSNTTTGRTISPSAAVRLSSHVDGGANKLLCREGYGFIAWPPANAQSHLAPSSNTSNTAGGGFPSNQPRSSSAPAMSAMSSASPNVATLGNTSAPFSSPPLVTPSPTGSPPPPPLPGQQGAAATGTTPPATCLVKPPPMNSRLQQQDDHMRRALGQTVDAASLKFGAYLSAAGVPLRVIREVAEKELEVATRRKAKQQQQQQQAAPEVVVVAVEGKSVDEGLVSSQPNTPRATTTADDEEDEEEDVSLTAALDEVFEDLVVDVLEIDFIPPSFVWSTAVAPHPSLVPMMSNNTSGATNGASAGAAATGTAAESSGGVGLGLSPPSSWSKRMGANNGQSLTSTSHHNNAPSSGGNNNAANNLLTVPSPSDALAPCESKSLGAFTAVFTPSPKVAVPSPGDVSSGGAHQQQQHVRSIRGSGISAAGAGAGGGGVGPASEFERRLAEVASGAFEGTNRDAAVAVGNALDDDDELFNIPAAAIAGGEPVIITAADAPPPPPPPPREEQRSKKVPAATITTTAPLGAPFSDVPPCLMDPMTGLHMRMGLMTQAFQQAVQQRHDGEEERDGDGNGKEGGSSSGDDEDDDVLPDGGAVGGGALPKVQTLRIYSAKAYELHHQLSQAILRNSQLVAVGRHNTDVRYDLVGHQPLADNGAAAAGATATDIPDNSLYTTSPITQMPTIMGPSFPQMPPHTNNHNHNGGNNHNAGGGGQQHSSATTPRSATASGRITAGVGRAIHPPHPPPLAPTININMAGGGGGGNSTSNVNANGTSTSAANLLNAVFAPAQHMASKGGDDTASNANGASRFNIHDATTTTNSNTNRTTVCNPMLSSPLMPLMGSAVAAVSTRGAVSALATGNTNANQPIVGSSYANATATGVKTLTIVHFNDVYNLDVQGAPDSRGIVGGASRFHTVLERIREYDNPLVLFSGDFIAPSLMSVEMKGRHMVDAFNLFGVHYGTWGNHEFDYGKKSLSDAIHGYAHGPHVYAGSNAKWIATNMFEGPTYRNSGDDKDDTSPAAATRGKDGGADRMTPATAAPSTSSAPYDPSATPSEGSTNHPKLPPPPSVRFRNRKPIAGAQRRELFIWNGVTIGIMGISENWLPSCAMLAPTDWIYEDMFTVAEETAQELRAEGAEVVLCLSHSRIANDKELMRRCPSVDLLLGGHDHFYRCIPNLRIVKGGAEFQFLTEIRIELSPVGLLTHNLTSSADHVTAVTGTGSAGQLNADGGGGVGGGSGSGNDNGKMGGFAAGGTSFSNTALSPTLLNAAAGGGTNGSAGAVTFPSGSMATATSNSVGAGANPLLSRALTNSSHWAPVGTVAALGGVGGGGAPLSGGLVGNNPFLNGSDHPTNGATATTSSSSPDGPGHHQQAPLGIGPHSLFHPQALHGTGVTTSGSFFNNNAFSVLAQHNNNNNNTAATANSNNNAMVVSQRRNTIYAAQSGFDGSELLHGRQRHQVMNLQIFCHPITVDIPENPQSQKLVSKYNQKLGERMDGVIGKALVELDPREQTCRFKEGILTGFVCDVIVHELRKLKYAADFALLGGAAFSGKAIIPAGDLKVGDIFSCFPNDTRIMCLRMPGEIVIKTLNAMVKEMPAEAPSFPHCSGDLKFVINLFKTPPVVEDVMVRGEPIGLKKEYVVGLETFAGLGKAKYKFIPPNSTTLLDGENAAQLVHWLIAYFMEKQGQKQQKIEAEAAAALALKDKEQGNGNSGGAKDSEPASPLSYNPDSVSTTHNAKSKQQHENAAAAAKGPRQRGKNGRLLNNGSSAAGGGGRGGKGKGRRGAQQQQQQQGGANNKRVVTASDPFEDDYTSDDNGNHHRHGDRSDGGTSPNGSDGGNSTTTRNSFNSGYRNSSLAGSERGGGGGGGAFGGRGGPLGSALLHQQRRANDKQGKWLFDPMFTPIKDFKFSDVMNSLDKKMTLKMFVSSQQLTDIPTEEICMVGAVLTENSQYLAANAAMLAMMPSAQSSPFHVLQPQPAFGGPPPPPAATTTMVAMNPNASAQLIVPPPTTSSSTTVPPTAEGGATVPSSSLAAVASASPAAALVDGSQSLPVNSFVAPHLLGGGNSYNVSVIGNAGVLNGLNSVSPPRETNSSGGGGGGGFNTLNSMNPAAALAAASLLGATGLNNNNTAASSFLSLSPRQQQQQAMSVSVANTLNSTANAFAAILGNGSTNTTMMLQSGGMSLNPHSTVQNSVNTNVTSGPASVIFGNGHLPQQGGQLPMMHNPLMASAANGTSSVVSVSASSTNPMSRAPTTAANSSTGTSHTSPGGTMEGGGVVGGTAKTLLNVFSTNNTSSTVSSTMSHINPHGATAAPSGSYATAAAAAYTAAASAGGAAPPRVGGVATSVSLPAPTATSSSIMSPVSAAGGSTGLPPLPPGAGAAVNNNNTSSLALQQQLLATAATASGTIMTVGGQLFTKRPPAMSHRLYNILNRQRETRLEQIVRSIVPCEWVRIYILDKDSMALQRLPSIAGGLTSIPLDAVSAAAICATRSVSLNIKNMRKAKEKNIFNDEYDYVEVVRSGDYTTNATMGLPAVAAVVTGGGGSYHPSAASSPMVPPTPAAAHASFHHPSLVPGVAASAMAGVVAASANGSSFNRIGPSSASTTAATAAASGNLSATGPQSATMMMSTAGGAGGGLHSSPPRSFNSAGAHQEDAFGGGGSPQPHRALTTAASNEASINHQNATNGGGGGGKTVGFIIDSNNNSSNNTTAILSHPSSSSAGNRAGSQSAPHSPLGAPAQHPSVHLGTINMGNNNNSNNPYYPAGTTPILLLPQQPGHAEVKTLLCVPIIYKGEVIGVMQAINKVDKAFLRIQRQQIIAAHQQRQAKRKAQRAQSLNHHHGSSVRGGGGGVPTTAANSATNIFSGVTSAGSSPPHHHASAPHPPSNLLGSPSTAGGAEKASKSTSSKTRSSISDRSSAMAPPSAISTAAPPAAGVSPHLQHAAVAPSLTSGGNSPPNAPLSAGRSGRMVGSVIVGGAPRRGTTVGGSSLKRPAIAVASGDYSTDDVHHHRGVGDDDNASDDGVGGAGASHHQRGGFNGNSSFATGNYEDAFMRSARKMMMEISDSEDEEDELDIGGAPRSSKNANINDLLGLDEDEDSDEEGFTKGGGGQMSLADLAATHNKTVSESSAIFITPPKFENEKEGDHLMLLSRSVANQLHHHLLKRKMKRSEAVKVDLMNMAKMLGTASRDDDVKNIIHKIASIACSVFNCDRASVFLVEKGTLWTVVKGKENETVTIRFPIGKGIAGECARTGRLSNIHDAYACPLFNVNIDKQTGYRTRTILAVPIMAENKIDLVGVLQLINKNDYTVFNQEDIELAYNFVDLAGIAIHNSFEIETLRVDSGTSGLQELAPHELNRIYIKGGWRTVREKLTYIISEEFDRKLQDVEDAEKLALKRARALLRKITQRRRDVNVRRKAAGLAEIPLLAIEAEAQKTLAKSPSLSPAARPAKGGTGASANPLSPGTISLNASLSHNRRNSLPHTASFVLLGTPSKQPVLYDEANNALPPLTLDDVDDDLDLSDSQEEDGLMSATSKNLMGDESGDDLPLVGGRGSDAGDAHPALFEITGDEGSHDDPAGGVGSPHHAFVAAPAVHLTNDIALPALGALMSSYGDAAVLNGVAIGGVGGLLAAHGGGGAGHHHYGGGGGGVAASAMYPNAPAGSTIAGNNTSNANGMGVSTSAAADLLSAAGALAGHGLTLSDRHMIINQLVNAHNAHLRMKMALQQGANNANGNATTTSSNNNTNVTTSMGSAAQLTAANGGAGGIVGTAGLLDNVVLGEDEYSGDALRHFSTTAVFEPAPPPMLATFDPMAVSPHARRQSMNPAAIAARHAAQQQTANGAGGGVPQFPPPLMAATTNSGGGADGGSSGGAASTGFPMSAVGAAMGGTTNNSSNNTGSTNSAGIDGGAAQQQHLTTINTNTKAYQRKLQNMQSRLENARIELGQLELKLQRAVAKNNAKNNVYVTAKTAGADGADGDHNTNGGGGDGIFIKAGGGGDSEELLLLFASHLGQLATSVMECDRASIYFFKNGMLIGYRKDPDRAKCMLQLTIGSGVAGKCAELGQIMNVPNAYKCDFFNRAFDRATGYRTNSILCMPLLSGDGSAVIAVLQLINKDDDRPFGADDEFAASIVLSMAVDVLRRYFTLEMHVLEPIANVGGGGPKLNGPLP